MNVLAYYRARQRGLEPDEAADEAGGRDPLSEDPTPDPPDVPDTPDQAPAAAPATQAPAPPMSLPPTPAESHGLSSQLSAALARARQRPQMPQDIGDDALAKSMADDEQQAAKDKFTESLRAAFARQRPDFSGVSSGPSAATKALQLKRQTFQQDATGDQTAALKEAQLLKAAEPKPLDPSLALLHQASALNLQGLERQRAEEEKRRLEETKRKSDETTKTKDAESASLEGEKAALLADPRSRRLGLTPDMVAKLDRHGLDQLRAELGHKVGGAGGVGGGGGKRLPASSLKDLADLDAADAQLAHLEEQAKGANIGSLKSSAVSMLPERLKANTDIGKYEDAARAAMQAVGVILEHGKLAAGDELKYRRMLPEAGDDVPTLSHKISELRGYLKELKGRHTESYKAGGYAVPDSAAHGGSQRTTPSGKPYATMQRNKRTGAVRYLDADGSVIE